VLSPISNVPGKRNGIPGAKAKTRINTMWTRFYLAGGAGRSDRNSSVYHSTRPGEFGPEVELGRATVKGNKRHFQSIRSMWAGHGNGTESIAIQRWEVAATVFRFTLGEPLPPGEYALAEILPDGMNLLFGILGWMGPAYRLLRNNLAIH